MRDEKPMATARRGPAAVSGLVLFALLASCSGRPPLPSEYGPSPGERLVYDVEYLTASTADFRALFEDQRPVAAAGPTVQPTGPQSYGTELRGELSMTVLERGPDRILCAYRFGDPRVELSVGGTSAPAQAESVAAVLRRETFAEMDPSGRLARVLIPAQADRTAQGFIAALLAKTQFVLPSKPRSRARGWISDEEDPNGRYQARYEAVVTPEGHGAGTCPQGLVRFRKTKEKYFPVERAAKQLLPRLPAIVQPSGSTEMMFDVTGGFIEAAEGSETERVTVSGREVARVESRLSFRRVGGGAVPSSEHLALLQAFRWRKTLGDFTPLALTFSEEESEQAIQRSALGRETLGSLRTALAKAEAEGRRQDTGLYLKFKALVYLHPEVSAELGDDLAAAGPGSLTADIIGGAIGAVGHPEAQAALAAAIRSRAGEPRFAIGLIQALSQASFPTDVAVTTLRDIAAGPSDGPLYEAAALGLGTMSRHLKDTDQAGAARIVDGLISSFGPSPAEREADILLKALGNSGSDRALPLLERSVARGPARLRASAAAGLRFVDSGRADALLVETLVSESEAMVRLSALLALGFRRPTAKTVEAHIRVVSRDGSEAVRLAALRNMGGMVEDFPEVLAVIRRVFAEDGSESVRKTAENILATRGEERR